MKKSRNLIIAILTLILSVAGSYTVSAQEIEVPKGFELVDSLVYIHVAGVDTLLAGKDIFHIMPLKAKGGNADVEIYQSQEVANALRKQIQENSKRAMNGYRVRIFFDNKQTARVESEETIKRFEDMYHDVKALSLSTTGNSMLSFTTKALGNSLLIRESSSMASDFVLKSPTVTLKYGFA